jgi:outer membrane protein TolC
VKVRQRAKVALDEAKAAGERLRVVKFDLQKRVLFAWAEYTSGARSIAAARSDLETLRLLEAAAGAAVRTGGGQEGLLRVRVEAEEAERRVRDLEAEQEAARAGLNGLLGRPARATLAPSLAVEARRNTSVTDEALVAAAVDTFPEIALMGQELEGRRDAVELARLQWLPDITPSLSFTGTVAQAVGAAITLPTTVSAIRGSIRAAEADVRAGEALLRQRRADRMGEYVGLLVTLRRAQERTAWIEGTLKPAIRSLADVRLRGYEAGRGDLAAALEAQRLLVEAEIASAESWAQAERALVDIECCLGVDIERLEHGDTSGGTGAPAAEGAQQEHGHG